MSVTITKVSIVPVSEDQEVNYYLSRIFKLLGNVRKLIDEYGAKYDHETPWDDSYLEDPTFFLYRAKISAVGRINSCESAARLGLLTKTPADTCHFTSMALYYVFRIARQMKREHGYAKKLEKWMNGFIVDRNSDSRFLEYRKAYGEKEED